MALIKCSECGHDVSDKAAICPNCGCPVKISTQGPTQEGSQTKERNLPAIPKEKLLLVGGIIVAVIVLGLLFKTFVSSRLSVYEKEVASCAEKLINDYADKKSFRFTNDIWYAQREDGTYVIIEYYDDNSGDNVAYFIDDVFVGTDSDYAKLESMGMATQTMIDIGKGRIVLATKNVVQNLGDPNTDSSFYVSAKKIAKRLKVKSDV